MRPPAPAASAAPVLLARALTITLAMAIAPALAVVLAACGGGGGGDGGGDGLVLDGRPRVPDAEGVVEEISFERIALDGGPTYGVAPDLASFSTYDLAPVPMLHRKGQYVHLGLDGDEVQWMAGIGVVIRAPGEEPVVLYAGHLLRVEDGGRGERRAVFGDGTVLRLADGVESPVAEGFVRAEIDPERRRVRALATP